MPRLSYPTGGEVVKDWGLKPRHPGFESHRDSFSFSFFSLSNWFTGIYRRTFTLLSDQGLVAKSIG